MKWLRAFPTTPALCVTGIAMAMATTVAVFLNWKPPDGWFLFVAGFAGVGAAQFIGKRATWSKEGTDQ